MCQFWHFPQMAHDVGVDHSKHSATGYQTTSIQIEPVATSSTLLVIAPFISGRSAAYLTARGCLDHQGDSVTVGDADQMAGLDLAHLGS